MRVFLFVISAILALLAGMAIASRIKFNKAEAAFPPEGSFVSVEGIRLHVLRKGAGAPVVLLHGGILAANDFDGVMDLLANRGYEAIAFDRPGYGHSERPPGRVTPADQARLIRGALQQLGVEKPIIIGHSWSGLLAMTCALDYPDDLSGVVLVAGAMYKEGYPAEHGDPISRLATAPVLGKVFLHTVLGSPLGTMLANAAVDQTFAPEPVPEGYREAVLALWLRPGQFRANRADILAFPDAAKRASADYRHIRLPVVIAVGDEDPFGTQEQAVRLKQDLPHAKLLTFPGAGHMIPQNRPELVLEAIEALKGGSSE